MNTVCTCEIVSGILVSTIALFGFIIFGGSLLIAATGLISKIISKIRLSAPQGVVVSGLTAVGVCALLLVLGL